MQVTLTPELEQIIQACLSSGKYQNAVEVLLAGVKLLQREETPVNMTFGILNEQSQFLPLTESEMIEESLKVLENHRNDTIPHHEVEKWVNRLTVDSQEP
jgi:putative addiction module CopG family antidote